MTDAMDIWSRRVWPLAALIGLVVATAKLGALGPASLQQTVVIMLINLMLVTSLYIFVGNSGVFSFGHLSFMAIGAYTAGVLTIPGDRKAILLGNLPDALMDAHAGSFGAILLGGITAGAFGALVAVPLVRLTGIVAALATFAVLLIVNVVAKNWSDVTNGTRGMSAIPITTTVDRALLFAVGSLVIAFAFQESPVGRRLRASRADETAVQALGVSVTRERGVAFVLSGFVGGVAGALYAQSLGSIGPDAFFLTLTFLTIAMLVVGGIANLSGAVVGTLVVSSVAELLRRGEEGFTVGPVAVHGRAGLAEMGLGVIMLGILIFLPRGITLGREITWPLGHWETVWYARRRSKGAARPVRTKSGE